MESSVRDVWPLYFGSEEAVGADDQRLTAIEALATYARAREGVAAQLDRRRHVALDAQEEATHAPLQPFVSILVEQPQQLLPVLAAAFHLALASAGHAPAHPPVRVRVYNLPVELPFARLKSNVVERFVCIRGTVVRVSAIQPLVTRLNFRCARCDTVVEKVFEGGVYEPLTKCPASKCQSRSLDVERRSCSTIDLQRIRVQELNDDSIGEVGHVPRSIDVELTHDLVDTVVPGDIVKICGIVKALKTQVPASSSSKSKSSLYVLYLLANSLVNEKRRDKSDMSFASASTKSLNAFTLPHLHAIQAIHEHADVFSLIVNSLCPSIFGHELVKGCRKHVGDSHNVPIRGDLHVLVVGDPGLGKSQMLRAVARACPRAVYVCANSSSTSGLTVTLVKEPTGDYALEAGALVIADKGVCCIDELDKMTADYHALLETMEQQSISIAKAGIVCTLSARTSIIAAANPVGGHYNRSKTVSENLKMSGALLSRFDLIFILLDTSNSSRDELISEHVIQLHAHATPALGSTNTADWRSSSMSYAALEGDGLHETLSIKQRLSLSQRDRTSFNAIPPQLLRTYIAYAKQYVHPKLSAGAQQVLSAYYLRLRKEHHNEDGTPITTRQIESLIRMAEARARIELAEVVSESHANDVVEIMKDSLYDVFSDDNGECDFSRSRGLSKAKLSSAFLKTLRCEARREERRVFSMEEMYELARSKALQIDDFNSFIDNLNQQGLLLNKGRRNYELV